MKLLENGLEPVQLEVDGRVGHRYDVVQLSRADFHKLGRMTPWQLANWLETMQRGFRPFSPI